MTSDRSHDQLVIVSTDQSFEQACRALEAAIPQQGFGLLGSHDLGGTLRAKGIDFKEKCCIYEVCQPQQAAAVLERDLRLNMALPCRLSVYSEAGQTRIGMISPAVMLSALSSDAALVATATDVEKSLRAIIESAAEPTA